MAEEPTPETIEAHQNEGYRALGHYVAAFSVMVAEMRGLMARRLSRPGDPVMLSSFPFSDMTATPIAKVFFRMCRVSAEHDDDEKRAAARLRRLILEAAEVRNKVAHAD